MGLDINISHNFDQLDGYLDDLKTNAAIQATRHSINRTLLTLRKQSVIRIRERLSVKPSVLKKKHLVIDRAKGGNLNTMEGLIKYNSTPIPLLEFVTGAQQRRSQKGIKVKNRKPIKARIRPGKTVALQHAFIATVRTKQVFKRKDTNTRKVKKQGITSVGWIFNKPSIRKELEELGGKRFTSLFQREYKRRVEKAAQRRNAKSRSRR